MVPDNDRDQYLQHVAAFYEQISVTVMNMQPEERLEFFRMVTDYSGVLGKLFPNMHLLKLATGESTEVLTDAQQAYMSWKQAQG